MPQNPSEIKEKILSFIRSKGPSLPVHLAKEINMESIFAGAFLSQLASEKEIKISNLKVGGSPLYFLSGQEAMLENFHNYLPQKEKEAFLLLKEKKLLQDSELEPAIRVALRNLKDFAYPLAEEKTLYWRFHSISEEQAISLEKKPVKREEKPLTTEKPILKLAGKQEKKEKAKSEFAKHILAFISQENLELLEEKDSRKKEYAGIIRANSDLGKLKFLIVAKDKKVITENDLAIAREKAQSLKMPTLIISTGQPDKKAAVYLEQYSGLIKFRHMPEKPYSPSQ